MALYQPNLADAMQTIVTLMTQIFFSSFFLALSLIAPLGAQNSFVFRQGIRKQHVFVVCLLCTLSDILLIAIGVVGFDFFAGEFRWLIDAARYGGSIFLLFYGLLSVRSALFDNRSMEETNDGDSSSLSVVALTCLALTWLNPHVYLDTVVLLGSISSQFEGHKMVFYLGTVTGSTSFFFVLGYGARILRPLFRSPWSWKLLDLGIALLMWYIAYSLVTGQL